MHKIGLFGRLLVSVAIMFVGMTGHAVADSSSGGFAKRVAGSYLIDHENSEARNVLTIGADGTFLMASSDERAFSFGNSQGARKRTSRRSIAAKVVNFNFDTNGLGIVRFEIFFDRKFRKMTGSFSGSVNENSVSNPLDDADIPAQFSDNFSGQRITVD